MGSMGRGREIDTAKQIAKRRDARRSDMFKNAYNGFGGSRDPMSRLFFNAGTVLSRTDLENLFRFDWVSRRIVEIFPEDATRQWIDFQTDDNDIVTDVMGRMETLETQNKIEEALILSRLYGGAVIIIGALDGQPPEAPLNENKISEVRFLNVLDRWQLEIDRKYSDPLKPNFGQPETYRLQPLATEAITQFNQKIHESRLIRFDGAYLPEIAKIANSGWYDSILTSINEELKRHGVSIQSGALLMQDFITKALKLPNLVEMLDDEEGHTALMNRIQFAIANMSSLGITLLGEGEEFTKIQTPIAGLVDLLNVYIEMISAASGIPRARLFGQSLGVLAGATETTRSYYDMVKAYQNKHIRRQLEKLIRLLLKDKKSITRGREPQEWGFDFSPLWQPTEKERVEVRKMMAETDKIYIDAQVVTPEEVAKSRFSPDGYNIETVIDIDLRAEYETEILTKQLEISVAESQETVPADPTQKAPLATTKGRDTIPASKGVE